MRFSKINGIFKNIRPTLIFLLFLGGILIFSIPLFGRSPIDPKWDPLDDEEKTDVSMDDVHSSRYAVFKFIKATVEEGSRILFLENAYSYFVLGQPYLYPEIMVEYTALSNSTDIINYSQTNSIDYIVVINFHISEANDTSLFEKINMDNTTYLLRLK